MLCHCGTTLTVSFEERDTMKLYKRQVVTRKYPLEQGRKKKKKKKKKKKLGSRSGAGTRNMKPTPYQAGCCHSYCVYSICLFLVGRGNLDSTI